MRLALIYKRYEVELSCKATDLQEQKHNQMSI